MEPDDARLQDTRAWLLKAELDLRAATHEMASPAAGLWGDVMFHSQQAAEKAMKAFLAWHDVPFRKTHNLEELGQQCVALDANLQNIADQAAPLTEYAWKYRYPGEPQEPDRAEAVGATGANVASIEIGRNIKISGAILLNWNSHRRSRNPSSRQLDRRHPRYDPIRNAKVHSIGIHLTGPSDAVDHFGRLAVHRHSQRRIHL